LEPTLFLRPLVWIFLFFQFQIFIFLINRFGIRPHRQVKEFLWVLFFLSAQGGTSILLAGVWDFQVFSVLTLPLLAQLYLGLVAGWVFLLWVDHAWWLLVRKKPVDFRVLNRRFPNRPSRWQAPFAFLNRTPFKNQIYDLEVVEFEVKLPGWPREWDGLSIVQVSDIHIGKFVHPDYLRFVVGEARKLKPDLYALTGDFISFAKDVPLIGKLFKGLKAPLGVYAVLGNHDHWADAPALVRVLKKDGVRVLINETVTLRRKGKNLALMGVDDKWTGNQDVEAVLKAPGDAKILLAHQPDHFYLAKKTAAHLQISGHCHGGQICFPLIGPLVVPSDEGRKYAAGFIREGNQTLFIHRGIGGYPPLRTLCPPQVVKLILKSAD
jgi:predicted MPP superfamily phosphohydrolase